MNSIDPNKYYNLSEFLEFVPWVKTLRALARWVDADMITENRLRAIKKGSGTGTRYFIKGENIIQYLANIEDKGAQYPSEGGDNNG